MKYLTIGGGGIGYRTPQTLLLRLANRHGLIAGATGTGKTITLQAMAEEFSRNGVSVFMADAKSDLSGMANPGCSDSRPHSRLTERAKQIGLTDYTYEQFPVTLWDVFGNEGIPVRLSIQSMGPMLFAKMLELSDAQEGVLSVIFAVAKERNMPLHTVNDLRAVMAYVAEHAKTITTVHGSVTPSGIGYIQRKLLMLTGQNAEQVFGTPALDLFDMLGTDERGYGKVNILAAERLMRTPSMYGSFLLWMLTELFHRLPEVGDTDKPKMVFFFDEAHMLFDGASRTLLRTVEQVVRLIRSKGVGVYFVTQNPTDIPDAVLGQLGNRVQHALRAFTARDQRAVYAASQTFRRNDRINTAEAITNMGVGEALVSFLDERGTPSMVDRTLIRPPSSQVGPITDAERRQRIVTDPLYDKYKVSHKSRHGASIPDFTQYPTLVKATAGLVVLGYVFGAIFLGYVLYLLLA
jgi:DNA helicase HerA-like ATPase